MASSYYKPCPELDRCDELIEKYWDTEQYDKCFAGHLELAERGIPLAECQVGYFYRGLGEERPRQGVLLDAAPLNTATATGSTISPHFMRNGEGVGKNMDEAKRWYLLAAQQNTVGRFSKCRKLKIVNLIM